MSFWEIEGSAGASEDEAKEAEFMLEAIVVDINRADEYYCGSLREFVKENDRAVMRGSDTNGVNLR